MARITKYEVRQVNEDNFKYIELVKESSKNYSYINANIHNPSNLYDVIDILDIKDKAEEELYLICVDTKNKINGIMQVSKGTLNSSLIHPREIFKRALLVNAQSIFLVHNHPSGDLTPSGADIRATEAIKNAGEIIGITLLDHIIVYKNKHKSLAEEGYI